MEVERNKTEIKLQGKLDGENASEIEEQLAEILRNKAALIIDLNGLELLDIGGINMLFDFKQKAKRKYKNVSIILDPSKTIEGI